MANVLTESEVAEARDALIHLRRAEEQQAAALKNVNDLCERFARKAEPGEQTYNAGTGILVRTSRKESSAPYNMKTTLFYTPFTETSK